MGTIIPLHGDPHEETQRLLPWHVTGTLDAAERAMVESHLAQCAQCRADLADERRLRGALTETATVPDGWEALRRRAAAARPAGRPWRAMAAAASITLVVASGATYVLVRTRAPAEYHTLGAPVPAPAGNIIVMFQPDLPEHRLRSVLDAVGARLSDGPTAAGAYLLSVPEDRRQAVLAALRAQPGILLAQPIDAQAGR